MATSHSNTVGAYEARTHLSDLLEKVEAGEEITITKRAVPVARLVPVRKEASLEERVAAIKRIQKLASGLSLRGLSVKDPNKASLSVVTICSSTPPASSAPTSATESFLHWA
jgi:prevent-host-death family protein